MDIERLCAVYQKGIENEIFIYKSDRRQILKTIIYLIIGLFFSKRSKTCMSVVIISNGSRQYKILTKRIEQFNIFPCQYILRGNILKGMFDSFGTSTFFSFFSFSQRFHLLVQALSIFKRRKNLKYCERWIEFYFISSFFDLCKVEKVIVAGHYDCFTTWISYLVSRNHSDLNLFQHGIISTLDIPHKIICSKVFGFSDKENNLFKQFVIGNCECEYLNAGYMSTVQFEKFQNKSDLLIGIISQANSTLLICDIALKLSKLDFVKIVVQQHPLEKKKSFKSLVTVSNIIVEPVKKYFDLDILIVVSSTMFYDYIVQGYQGQIVQLLTSDCSYDYCGENLHQVVSVDEIVCKVNALCTDLEQRKDS